ncbi:hypothetical protein, partial [Tannerella forsythia]|uniref:hypothetical protein n=1 Tax=Tannerella forsythia TaxID=28112 RepID=UPI0028EA9394
KENQAVRSEASYLIFRPASVARACEAHEALTFGLLLGQAKSDKKRLFADALNDKGSEKRKVKSEKRKVKSEKRIVKSEALRGVRCLFNY